MMIHGVRVAQEVASMMLEKGVSLEALLQEIDGQYESSIANRRPEEILFD
jgi:hypothetical protein